MQTVKRKKKIKTVRCKGFRRSQFAEPSFNMDRERAHEIASYSIANGLALGIDRTRMEEVLDSYTEWELYENLALLIQLDPLVP